MATAFGDFDVRLDPWAVEYGGETPIDFPPDADESVQVEVDVEVPSARWLPVSPPPQVVPVSVAFVDGVRRVEARLVVSRGGRLLHGAIGSYGVGAAIVSAGRAQFGGHVCGRLAVFGSGQIPPAPVIVSPDLVYAPRSVPEDDPEAPLRGVHAEMRSVEERFARRLAEVEGTLVIADGPLNIGEATRGRAVGLVKRLFKIYLPVEQQSILRTITIGCRTPVFLIRKTVRFSRYSWFARLGAGLRMESELTGLVRLEVADAVGIDEARRLADLTTALLPRFVPSRTRDPRAPQNLMPIGALEQHLRRLLGDARLIKRRLATLLAQETTHV